MDRFVDVAVNLPVEGSFSYSVPAHLEKEAAAGKRVLVPFGRRTVTGYILSFVKEPGVETVKPILDVLDDVPVVDSKRLKFLRWLSSYYFAPIGEVLALTHPSSVNIKSYRHFYLTDSGRGVLEVEKTSAVAGEVLRASEKGVTLAALLRRFKGKSVYSTVESLKGKGFLRE
ncbi:MAG: hypothetical protein V3W31_06505, partial [Thermodesulfobacteriota bacterium]